MHAAGQMGMTQSRGTEFIPDGRSLIVGRFSASSKDRRGRSTGGTILNVEGQVRNTPLGTVRSLRSPVLLTEPEINAFHDLGLGTVYSTLVVPPDHLATLDAHSP